MEPISVADQVTRTVRLLGRPEVDPPAGRQPSRKSFALLAYLLLGPPSSRRRLAELLFPDADDPLGALRWALADLRRALGGALRVDGDPVRTALHASVDVLELQGARWNEVAGRADLGAALLDGAAFTASPEFELWLAFERRRLADLAVTVLHEAAMACLVRGRHDEALAHARRVVALAPLEETAHELLLRTLVGAGAAAEARDHLRSATAMLRSELGQFDPVRLARAARAHHQVAATPTRGAVRGLLEAGEAAIGAGAVPDGLGQLERAVAAARRCGDDALLVEGLTALGTALVHAARGSDEEGVALLHEASALTAPGTPASLVSRIHRELGYVEFLRGHYERARHWLARAGESADDPAARCWIDVFVGACRADVGAHEAADRHFSAALEAATAADDLRAQAYTRSFVGRGHLLRGELAEAARDLDRAIDEFRRAGWTTALPWAMALRAETARAGGDVTTAGELAEHAFSLACQIGDPCWESVAARVLGLLAADRGDVTLAVEHLTDARGRAERLPDTYVWARVWVTQARCEVAVRHGLPDADEWLATLEAEAARYGLAGMLDRAARLRARRSRG